MATSNRTSVSSAPNAEAIAPSPLAQELVDSGAEPTDVDVNELIARLQEQSRIQQTQLAQLLAERGIPSDPQEALLVALQGHLKAQANANPRHADTYADAIAYADGITMDKLNERKAYKLRNIIETLRETVPGHELGYVGQLSKELHMSTIDDSDDDE